METDASVETVWLRRLNEPANDGINLFDVGTDQFYGSDRDRAGLCYQASVVMNKILKVSVGKLLFNTMTENNLTDVTVRQKNPAGSGIKFVFHLILRD